jgi:hypothetical protein
VYQDARAAGDSLAEGRFGLVAARDQIELPLKGQQALREHAESRSDPAYPRFSASETAF